MANNFAKNFKKHRELKNTININERKPLSSETVDSKNESSTINESTQKFNLKEIPVQLISVNKYNESFRKLDTDDKIEELALSISIEGLLSPITVTPDKDNEGRYILISGERRYLACTKFLGWTSMPANIVETQNVYDNIIKLYESNLKQREYTPTQKLSLFNDLYEALQQRNKINGVNASVSDVNEEAAKVLDISVRTIARYKELLKYEEELKQYGEDIEKYRAENESLAKLNKTYKEKLNEYRYGIANPDPIEKPVQADETISKEEATPVDEDILENEDTPVDEVALEDEAISEDEDTPVDEVALEDEAIPEDEDTPVDEDTLVDEDTPVDETISKEAAQKDKDNIEENKFDINTGSLKYSIFEGVSQSGKTVTGTGIKVNGNFFIISPVVEGDSLKSVSVHLISNPKSVRIIDTVNCFNE